VREPFTMSRRRLLGLGVSLPLLAGCTLSDPTVNDPERTPPAADPSASPSSSTTRTPTPTPTPTVRGARSVATTELGLAGLAQAILTGPRRSGLSADQRRLIEFVVRAHQAHAAAVDPTAAPPKPARVEQLTLPRSLARLARNQQAAAVSHRAAALAVSGRDAARIGAVAAAAGLYSRVIIAGDPVPLAAPATRVNLPLLPDVEAVQSLVIQLHALIYGYQLAIGRLPVAGARHARAVAELLQHRIRRDRLIGWLIQRSAEVPVAEPAYRPSVEPRNSSSAAKLIRTMLVALQPFGMIWLAAAGEADRESAFTTFNTIVGMARAWDAPLPIWPGGTS
jgi:Domain of unknown function (DUF4439)